MRHTWAHMFSDKWWWRSYVLVMLFLVSFNDKGLVVFIHFNAEFLHISSTKVYRLWVCSSSPSSMAQMSSPGAGGAFACKERHLVVEGDPCRQAEHLQSFFFFFPSNNRVEQQTAGRASLSPSVWECVSFSTNHMWGFPGWWKRSMRL